MHRPSPATNGLHRFVLFFLPFAIASVLGAHVGAQDQAEEAQEEGPVQPPAETSAETVTEAEGVTQEPAAQPQPASGLVNRPATATGEAIDEAEQQADQEEAVVEPPAPPPPPPWRGSLFGWQQGITADTLNPGARLTYNPTYYWSLYAQGRWYVDPQNFFVLTLAGSMEFTDADLSTHVNEFQFGDTVLEWRHMETLSELVLITSTRLAAPTSLGSIAAERILNLGGSVTAVKVFPELASFTIALGVGARYWFAASNVLRTLSREERYPAVRTPLGTGGGDFSSSQVSGTTAEQMRLTSSLTLSVAPFSGFTVSGSYFLGGILGHGLAPAPTGAIGDNSLLPDDQTHWRPVTYFGISIAYDVVAWLNLQLGYQSAAIFNPFWNVGGRPTNVFYNPDSELFLVATLSFEALVNELQGEVDDGLTPEERLRRRQGLANGPSRSNSF